MDYIIFCGALKQRHQNNIISVPDDVKRENVDRYVLSWGYVYAIIRSSPALGNNNNTFNHWYQWRVDQNLTLFLSNEEGGRVFCGYPDISGSGVGVLIIIVPPGPHGRTIHGRTFLATSFVVFALADERRNGTTSYGVYLCTCLSYGRNITQCCALCIVAAGY